jgi:hypothetical protein
VGRRIGEMTDQQDARVKEFDGEIKKRGTNAVIDWKESNTPESRGILFADVDGITLMVYRDGLISIPAVRTYHPPRYSTPIIAAVLAEELWTRQKTRDDGNLDTAKSRRTGHLGPIVGPDLKCRTHYCPCQRESSDVRQKRARGGFNWNPDQCS